MALRIFDWGGSVAFEWGPEPSQTWVTRCLRVSSAADMADGLTQAAQEGRLQILDSGHLVCDRTRLDFLESWVQDVPALRAALAETVDTHVAYPASGIGVTPTGRLFLASDPLVGVTFELACGSFASRSGGVQVRDKLVRGAMGSLTTAVRNEDTGGVTVRAAPVGYPWGSTERVPVGHFSLSNRERVMEFFEFLVLWGSIRGTWDWSFRVGEPEAPKEASSRFDRESLV